MVAYFHHARFSDGPHGSSVGCAKKFFDLLYQAKADLVLSGHNHIYERLTDTNAQGTPVADGTDQFVVGQGATTPTPSPWSTRASPHRPRAPWTSGTTPVRTY